MPVALTVNSMVTFAVYAMTENGVTQKTENGTHKIIPGIVVLTYLTPVKHGASYSGGCSIIQSLTSRTGYANEVLYVYEDAAISIT